MRRLILLVALSVICAACSPSAPAVNTADLPEGNAAAGETLFNTKIGGLAECSSCHSLDGTNGTGPSLAGFAAVAATRTGEDAVTYTYNSIITPGTFVVRGYSNVMPPVYAQQLDAQGLADLIAFVLAQ